MNVTFARALAHTEIYRSSSPLVRYHKRAVIDDESGDDWEPNQSPPDADIAAPPTAVASVEESEESLTNGYDCGCSAPSQNTTNEGSNAAD